MTDNDVGGVWCVVERLDDGSVIERHAGDHYQGLTYTAALTYALWLRATGCAATVEMW